MKCPYMVTWLTTVCVQYTTSLPSMNCTCLFIFKTIYSRIRRLSCVQRWSCFCAIVLVKSKFVKYGGGLFHGFCSYCSRMHKILVGLILHFTIHPHLPFLLSFHFPLLSFSSPFPSSISPFFPHLYPSSPSPSPSLSPSPDTSIIGQTARLWRSQSNALLQSTLTTSWRGCKNNSTMRTSFLPRSVGFSVCPQLARCALIGTVATKLTSS